MRIDKFVLQHLEHLDGKIKLASNEDLPSTDKRSLECTAIINENNSQFVNKSSEISSASSLSNILCDKKPSLEIKYTECHDKIDIENDKSQNPSISDKKLKSTENSNKNISNSLNDKVGTFLANNLTIKSFTNEKNIQSSTLNDCNL